jgi:hypothetical protein
MRVTNSIPLGCPLLIPAGTVNCVQPLQVHPKPENTRPKHSNLAHLDRLAAAGSLIPADPTKQMSAFDPTAALRTVPALNTVPAFNTVPALSPAPATNHVAATNPAAAINPAAATNHVAVIDRTVAHHPAVATNHMALIIEQRAPYLLTIDPRISIPNRVWCLLSLATSLTPKILIPNPNTASITPLYTLTLTLTLTYHQLHPCTL